MRQLFITRQFKKDVARIPRSIRTRGDEIILKLRKDALNSTLSLKKLAKVSPTAYRVRIGHYRLIFSFTKTSLTLHRFHHRKDIYRKL